MKKILMSAVVIGLFLVGAVTPNPKLSFRDIYLGMSRPDAQELADKYGDEHFRVVVQGDIHHKVWVIEVEAWHEDAERLKTAVFKKYGKPTKMWATDWKTLYGTTHKGISAEWHIGKDVVTFEFRPTDVVYGELEWGGFLRIMSSEYLESLKKGEMKL